MNEQAEQVYGVLVPVGPDGVGDGVLDVAAAEAKRLGTGVLMLHVVHSLIADDLSTERIESFDQALTKVGRCALTDAEAGLRQRLGGQLPVATEIVFGHVARTIAERGSDGRSIVMERRDPGALERLVTMSISTSVAAHARVPVVVVPPSWISSRGAGLPVTVAIEHPQDAKVDVDAALERARGLARPVVAFHAAWIETPYQPAIFAGYSREEWLVEATAALASALEGIAGVGDDVNADVRWERPVDALVATTERSAELVLRHRAPGLLRGSHLGPLTRAVLHHARCPVVVLPSIGSGDQS